LLKAEFYKSYGEEPLKVVANTALLLMFASSASAGELDRFQLDKTADGYVRLDRQSGDMSLCTQEGGKLICRPATDEHRAVDDQSAVLVKRIEALEARVAVLEGNPPAAASLPSDEEFEKAMGFMERFFRRFMDIVRGFEQEGDGAPRKT
jgi:hypothetical protein